MEVLGVTRTDLIFFQGVDDGLRACFSTLRTLLDCYNFILPFTCSLSFNASPICITSPFFYLCFLGGAGLRRGGEYDCHD